MVFGWTLTIVSSVEIPTVPTFPTTPAKSIQGVEGRICFHWLGVEQEKVLRSVSQSTPYRWAHAGMLEKRCGLKEMVDVANWQSRRFRCQGNQTCI